MPSSPNPSPQPTPRGPLQAADPRPQGRMCLGSSGPAYSITRASSCRTVRAPEGWRADPRASISLHNNGSHSSTPRATHMRTLHEGERKGKG